jgi:predicted ATPase
MGIVIGLSGAQGGGKTTLLAELARRGHAVDDFKVSRTVQAQLGWESLERVMESPQTMVDFEERCLEAKMARERELNARGTPVLTERTMADMAAYAALWTNKMIYQRVWAQEPAHAWVRDFIARCRVAHVELYAANLVLPLMPHIPVEADPHRAKAEDAETVYNSVVAFLGGLASRYRHQLHFITEAGVAERADGVERFLENLE